MNTYLMSLQKLQFVAGALIVAAMIFLGSANATIAATTQSNYQPQTLEEMVAYLYGIIAQLEAQIAAQEGQSIGGAVRPSGQVVTSVKTLSPTSVSDDRATLRGEVDFSGSATVRVWFEYGRTSSFGSRTSAVSVRGRANSFAKVSRPITGLRDDTRYYARLVVELPNGTKRYGNTERFMTDDEDDWKDGDDDWDDDWDDWEDNDSDDAALSVSDRSIRAGDTIQVRFSIDADDRSSTNWIGVYRRGANDTLYSTYQYISNDTRGTVEFTLFEEGEFEFRLFKDNGYIRLAESGVVTVR